MADKEMSALTAAATLTGAELVHVVQSSNSRKATAQDVANLGAVVATASGTNYDVEAEDVGKYIRLTNAAAKTVTVRPNSTEALPANGEWHFRNVGAGDATLTPGSGVTLHAPVGGTLIVEQGGTVTLKRVASDEFDVIGVTEAL